jgi:hypothetical protein
MMRVKMDALTKEQYLTWYYAWVMNELYAYFGDLVYDEQIEEYVNLICDDPDKSTTRAMNFLGRDARSIIYDEVRALNK